MCGIFGFISDRTVSDDLSRKLLDTMIHRGPDDHGLHSDTFGAARIVLGQRRLAILDLSPRGHQPMLSPDGNIAIVFNGEIYNFWDIRAELEARGHVFRSRSDTEVLVEGYREWGLDLVPRLNGMFAFALYDKPRQRLHLVRDRLGKKPLYYYQKGQDFVFASELKPIMGFPGFERAIRRDVVVRFLVRQYINPPETIFAGVSKLQPGELLTLSAGGEVIRKQYWDPLSVFERRATPPLRPYPEAEAEMAALIDDAVKVRLISDVPLGAFLSGGIDSSLTVALARNHNAGPLKTFSIGFEDPRFNEAEFARAVAQRLGTDHHELIVNEAAMLNVVDRLPHFYDEPFADSSQIPTMLVSELARQQVTVAISGDGGDELFCGYDRYGGLRRLQRMAPLLALSRPLRGCAEWLYWHHWRAGVVLGGRSWEEWLDFEAVFERFLTGFVPGSSVPAPIARIVKSPHWEESRMLLDMETYLSGDILTKVDRASMSCSLEVRCPLLDYRVVEAAIGTPLDFKFHAGIRKYMLKNILYKHVPATFFDRPKSGFSVPLEKWLRTALKDRLHDLTTDGYLWGQAVFDAGRIQELKRRFYAGQNNGKLEHVLWSLLMFQMWYDTYGRSAPA